MTASPEKILSDLIRINTANPPGNETAAARYLKQLFDAAGIPNEIIEPAEGRGSFIARWGMGPKKLLFISHSDVVPAGDDWDFDPFSGDIRNGMVYGRGAMDCKDLVASQACAMLAIARENIPLGGELIFAATADEETGGALGAEYLCEHHLDKIMADFAINEGALTPITAGGKMVYFFQVGEKGTAWSCLKAKGKAGHGSVPALGDNAVLKMAAALCKLEKYRPQVVLIPEVRNLIQELSRLQGRETTVDESNVDSVLDSLGLEHGFTEFVRAMTRMTASPNVIAGGSKTNIVPDTCRVEVDIRILPGQDNTYVASELGRVLGDEIEIEPLEYQAPTFSTSQSEFYRLMEEVTLELAGSDALCLPLISTGSTDSKFLRRAGIAAYGIGHMAAGYDPELKATMHGRNERIDIASLHLKTDFLKRVAVNYLR